MVATPKDARFGRMRGILLGTGLAILLSISACPSAFAAVPPGSPLVVSGPEISMLIRSTIVALHQANLTANYSVLRDLGDSQFQADYSQAALADMFRAFRAQRVNLEPVVLYDADLDAQPKLTADGLLRVTGHFATAPQQIIFDITFRNERGLWLIDAINAGMRPVPLAPPLAATLPSTPPGTPELRAVAVKTPPAARPTSLPGVVDVSAENSEFQ